MSDDATLRLAQHINGLFVITDWCPGELISAEKAARLIKGIDFIFDLF